jgi:hypothetical protein
MRRLWLSWVRLWSRRESATSLALLRVLVCASAAYSLTSIARDGVMDALWLGQEHGGILNLSLEHWLWRVLGAPSPGLLHTVWGVSLLSAGLGFFGLGGRWPLIAAQQSYVALTSLNGNAMGGYDTLISIALFVLSLSESHRAWSVPCWIQSKSLTSVQLVSGWPRTLLLVQLLLMYSATGLQKIGFPWTPMGGYTALQFVLYDPTWTLWPPTWVAALSPLLRLATALSWHWEQSSLLLLVVLYARRTRARGGRWRAWLNRWDLRIPWALVGVTMHVGILCVLNVGPFSWISLSYYVTLWSGDELDAFGSRLRQVRFAKT